MSSRVRYVMRGLGAWWHGSDVKQQLMPYHPALRMPAIYNEDHKAWTIDDYRRAAAACEAKLFVFKEPRNLPPEKSRYRKICKMYGLVPQKKKKAKLGEIVWGNPDIVGQLFQAPKIVIKEVPHGGANQPQGYAAGAPPAQPWDEGL